jgi:hypothetical protein
MIDRLVYWLLERGPMDWASYLFILFLLGLGALVFYVLHTL